MNLFNDEGDNACLTDLSEYHNKRHRKTIIINNEEIKSARNGKQAHLTYDICVKRKCKIEKQGCGLVQTKITIDGPIHGYTMMIKRHKNLPILGTLKTCGFISPFHKGVMKVTIQNTRNYEIR